MKNGKTPLTIHVTLIPRAIRVWRETGDAMLTWRIARLIIGGALILGSSVMLVQSPGWKVALAQVGYYPPPAAATTMWIDNHQWRNNVRVYGPPHSKSIQQNGTAEEFCDTLKKERASFNYRSDGPFLDVSCSPSGGTTLWVVKNQWTNGAGFAGPVLTNKYIVAETPRLIARHKDKL